jgi:tetratricopeptide (TPR) repeat protein
MNRAILVLLLLSLSATAEDKWIEVRTPHFRVVSNASEGRTKKAAENFEQMRAVLGIALTKIRLDHGEDFVVIGAADEGTMKELVPFYWEKRGQAKPGGLFMSGMDRDYAIVRLDYDNDYPTQVVCHEYVHKIIHASLRHVPVWLDEGLAEFYGSTRVRGSKTTIGNPGPRLSYLRSQTMLPLKELLTADGGSAHYNREDKVQKFYAQATALTHFLMFGPDKGNGKKMNEFISQLQSGKDQVEIFESVFGPLKKNEGELRNYLSKFLFTVFELNNPAGLKDIEMTPRKLTAAERDAELGWFHVRAGNRDAARRLIERSLKADENAIAHEAMGLEMVDENLDRDAAEHFKKAIALDPTRYRSAFYAAFTDRDLDANYRKKMLEDVLSRNPKFASALIAQSQVAAENGDLAKAQQLAIDAIKLEPFRAGFYSYLAAILERRGDKKSAAQVIRRVVEQWKGPDQAEAIEILRRLDQQGVTPDPDQEYKSESKRVLISSVQCSDDKSNSEMRIKFKDADGGNEWEIATKWNFMIGIPDTLWWVGHFRPCSGRMNGMPAVVRYKKKDAALELVSIEMRNPLMEPPAEAASAGK